LGDFTPDLLQTQREEMAPPELPLEPEPTTLLELGGPTGKKWDETLDEAEKPGGMLFNLWDDVMKVAVGNDFELWLKETEPEAMSAYGALGSEAAEALVMSNFENGFHAALRDANIEKAYCAKRSPAEGEAAAALAAKHSGRAPIHERPWMPNAYQRRRQYASLLQTQDGGAAAPEGFEAWWEEFKAGPMLKGSYDRMLQDIQSCIWGMTIRSVLRPDAKAALLAAGRGNETVDASDAVDASVARLFRDWAAKDPATGGRPELVKKFCAAVHRGECL